MSEKDISANKREISKWFATLAAGMIGWFVVNTNPSTLESNDNVRIYFYIILSTIVISLFSGIIFSINPEKKPKYFKFQMYCFVYGCFLIISGFFGSGEFLGKNFSKVWSEQISFKVQAIEVKFNHEDLEVLKNISMKISKEDVDTLQNIKLKLDASTIPPEFENIEMKFNHEDLEVLKNISMKISEEDSNILKNIKIKLDASTIPPQFENIEMKFKDEDLEVLKNISMNMSAEDLNILKNIKIKLDGGTITFKPTLEDKTKIATIFDEMLKQLNKIDGSIGNLQPNRDVRGLRGGE